MKKTTELELVGPDTGLTKEQMVQANELHAKFPAIVAAYKKVKEQENNLRGKWFSLCERLREPGDGVTLNSREMGLILRGLGEPKSRVSEIIKVVSVDDKVWAQYKANVVGFRAVLQLARAKPEEVETDGDTDETPEEKPKDKPVIKAFPKPVADAIALLLNEHVNSFEPTGKGYYELVFGTQKDDHGRKFTIAIEVDDIAKK